MTLCQCIRLVAQPALRDPFELRRGIEREREREREREKRVLNPGRNEEDTRQVTRDERSKTGRQRHGPVRTWPVQGRASRKDNYVFRSDRRISARFGHDTDSRQNLVYVHRMYHSPINSEYFAAILERVPSQPHGYTP